MGIVKRIRRSVSALQCGSTQTLMSNQSQYTSALHRHFATNLDCMTNRHMIYKYDC
jgi:hypothetical protein